MLTKNQEIQLSIHNQITLAITNTKSLSNQRTKGISRIIFIKIKSLKLLRTVIEFCSRIIPCFHIMLFCTIALVRFWGLIIDRLFLVWCLSKKGMRRKRSKKAQVRIKFKLQDKSKSWAKSEIALENT